MDEQLTRVHRDIYAIVASVQGGCQASKILFEYHANYGRLDFKKFGYKNLNEFLATVPKIFVSRNAIGEMLYKAKLADSKAAQEIQFQVSMQKAPNRDKAQNFKRSHSTRGHCPQPFQRQSRHRSSYGAAFATSSSHDNRQSNQSRMPHGSRRDYVSSWMRTSTPIDDSNAQKPPFFFNQADTYNRIPNRHFTPQSSSRQPPSYEQNYYNDLVQRSHAINHNHSGNLSQHSQQDLEKKSRDNSNPYRQKAAAATVPKVEAQPVAKTSQWLQRNEIKVECETASTKSDRSSLRGVALFNWGKKSKEELPKAPKRSLRDMVHSFSQMCLNEKTSSQETSKSQMRNESTEIKYYPATTPSVDGLTNRIDDETTPLVDYSFSDKSFSKEKTVSSLSSLKSIDERKLLKTTQITTTSVMNDVKSDEQVMSDLQRSTEDEPKSLQNLAAKQEQVMSGWQGNTKNGPKALTNLAVQQARDRQIEAHERRKAKIAAIIRRAVTDFGSTQQNHTRGDVKHSLVVSPLAMKKDLVDGRRFK